MSAISRVAVPRFNDAVKTPEIYQITVRGANILVIVESELILIDTGFHGCSIEIDNCLHQIGHSLGEIELIILTHNHIDHVGALRELKQKTKARAAIHKSDIGERENRPSAGAAYIDIDLVGGEIFDVLGGLEVIHTPGHTPGSISLFSSRYGLLFVGDALRRHRDVLHAPYKATGYDNEQAFDSIRKMSKLGSRIICFGHGLPLIEDIDAKITRLLQRYRD